LFDRGALKKGTLLTGHFLFILVLVDNYLLFRGDVVDHFPFEMEVPSQEEQ
jgi:hypothetical protein